MFLARVVGEVVATVKHPRARRPEADAGAARRPGGEGGGRLQIAVDTVEAGTGDHVLVADEGNSAAQVLRRPRGPIRTVIVGIVDEVDVPGEPEGAPD